MKVINFNELPKRCQKEYKKFYSVERFPHRVFVRKSGRKWELRFIEDNLVGLFKRQVVDISEWYIVEEY